MKGTYNFTDGYGKGVKDKAPDWMDELFNKGIQKSEPTIIKDLYTSDVKVKSCSKCGKILLPNEIGTCKSCINKK